MATAQDTQETPPADVLAYQHLCENVGNPVFFSKLAQAGIVPRNEDEKIALLEMGNQLYAQHDHQVKQASHQSLILGAHQHLMNEIANQPADIDHLCKVAASRACSDQQVLASALTVVRALQSA